ncbi:MAG: tetratricopeptide repeat protein [Actinobacteria bacterium]|nr:tetratricopeptide repeat protein [Actinomycetota bacterium]
MTDRRVGTEAGAATFTFLFTDIEGSTRLLTELGAAYSEVLRTHHEILREAIGAHDGVVERTEGDAFFALFPTAQGAVSAAVEAQRQFAAEPWLMDEPLKVRMGLHTGEASRVDDELVGLDIHRAARIAAVGWGGQILVSEASRQLLSGERADIELRDLGAHRLKDLDAPQHLYQVVCSGLREDFPALRSLDHLANNLPTELTGFIGRDREVRDVADLLATARVVTLTGPGGTGKTRLSIRTAAEVADRFSDGVFFVALAPIVDPDLVVPTIATTLGLSESANRPILDVVVDHLADKRALLVLDNFEQVLAAGPDIAKLVGDAPAVSVLVSSRAPLRIYGEHEYPVPPLPVPADAELDLDSLAMNEAVALFLARASAMQPGLQLTPENAPAIVAITRRLDGLPLAIELAAARVKLLPPTAIAERLDHALDLLGGGARDLPDRQRTLRGAIAWSWDLLEPASQALFARMSVFMGGASLAHIEAVCADDLPGDLFEALSDLVDHSLVKRHGDDRFFMLETIREYADERLSERDECDAVRRRHGDVFLDLLESSAPGLTGEAAVDVLHALVRDIDNLRAGIDRAVARADVRCALRLVGAGFRLWQMAGHLNEGAAVADRVLAMPGVDAHPRELGTAHETAGGIAYWRGDLPVAREHYQRALDRYREAGDVHDVARGLYNLGFGYWRDPERAVEHFNEALAVYETLGDEVGVARAHWGLGVANYWLHDYSAIQHHTEQCLDVFRTTGQAYDLTWALHMRGIAAYGLGRYDEAVPFFAEALQRLVAAGDVSGIDLVLADFALVAEAEGDDERSLRLWGAGERIAEESGSGLVAAQYDEFARPRRSDESVPPDRAAELREQGRRMNLEAAVSYALERVAEPDGGRQATEAGTPNG